MPQDYTGVVAAGAVSEGGSAKDKSDADVLSTARSRLDMAISALSESREDELDDLRFYAGSPDNHWQWPADVLATRGAVQGQTINAREPKISGGGMPDRNKETYSKMPGMGCHGSIPSGTNVKATVAKVLSKIK